MALGQSDNTSAATPSAMPVQTRPGNTNASAAMQDRVVLSTDMLAEQRRLRKLSMAVRENMRGMDPAEWRGLCEIRAAGQKRLLREQSDATSTSAPSAMAVQTHSGNATKKKRMPSARARDATLAEDRQLELPFPSREFADERRKFEGVRQQLTPMRRKEPKSEGLQSPTPGDGDMGLHQEGGAEELGGRKKGAGRRRGGTGMANWRKRTGRRAQGPGGRTGGEHGQQLLPGIFSILLSLLMTSSTLALSCSAKSPSTCSRLPRSFKT